MSLQILPDLVQRSEEWYAQRRGMVTASVVGKLITARQMTAAEYACPSCGAKPLEPCVSLVKRKGETGPAPIKTAHTERTAVATEKRDESPLIIEPATTSEARGLTTLLAAERITGWTDPTHLNDDMIRGIEDEPRAIDAYAEHYAPVTKVGFMIRDDWGWNLGYSPDGLVGDDGLVECKSRRSKGQLAAVLAGDVPAENYAQLQCGLLVSGRKWIDYISYAGGMPLWKKRVFPDPRWHEAIIAAVAKFERDVEQMIATYKDRTVDLPMTERIPELGGLGELKL